MSGIPIQNLSRDIEKISASLPTLWSHIEPALDYFFRPPTDGPATMPTLNNNYYMSITTALFEYCSKPTKPTPVPPASARMPATPTNLTRETQHGDNMRGADLYKRLDAYLAGVVREILLGAPQDADDDALIRYLVPAYTHYAAGAVKMHRLLNILNRYFLKREMDEGRGWLRPDKSSVARDPAMHLNKLRKERAAELGKWGWKQGDSADVLAQAEEGAEAASSPDCFVPLQSLARKRFRIGVLEPLLGMRTADSAASQESVGPTAPEDRLTGPLKKLLESSEGAPEERVRLAEMARMLRTCGIQPDHPIRVLLDEYTGAAS